MLSNEHFRSFYDKVLESDQVRQRVEKEKAQYAAEAQAAAKQAQESLSHVQDELKRFDDELISYLQELQWWNWPPEKIFTNLEALCKR